MAGFGAVPRAVSAAGLAVLPLVAVGAGASPAVAAGKKVVSGPVVQAGKYGPLRVEAVVRGSRLVGVRVPVVPKHGASATINRLAVPILVRSALAAQSGQVASVSGASATSAAFRKSLQAALVKARR